MAVAGTYQVPATSESCRTDAGAASTGHAGPFVLPPPALGIVLQLPCRQGPAPTPTITAISNRTVPAAGGTLLTATGRNLTKTTGVQVGTKSAGFTVLSPTAVQFTVPPGSGEQHVRVTASGRTSATTSADLINYEKLLDQCDRVDQRPLPPAGPGPRPRARTPGVFAGFTG